MITFDNSTEHYNSSASSQTFAHTVASGGSLIVFAGNRDRGAPTAQTYNGDSPDESFVSGQQGWYAWRTPDTGSAYNIVLTYSATGNVGANGLSYTGCNTTDIIGATNHTSGSGTSITGSLTTTADGSLVISGVVIGGISYTFTPTSSQTEREEGSPGGNFSSVSGDIIKASAGAQAMNWTASASQSWNNTMIEVKEPQSSGPANLKTWNGVAKANIKTINGVAIASIKTLNGIV